MVASSRVLDSDLPRLFQAADSTSNGAQAWFLRGTRVRLGLVVLAAGAGIVRWTVGASNVDVLSVVALVLFVFALVVEGLLWQSRPDRDWYDARAVAESTKTLAWKFAVGARPFPTTLGYGEASKALLSRMSEIKDGYPKLELKPIAASEISSWMRCVRAESFDERRAIYSSARLEDQLSWYTKNAKKNRRWARGWRATLVSLEAVGAVLAGVGIFTDLGGWALGPAVAALATAIVAWLETKQYDFNARAYAAAVNDLSMAKERVELASTEDEWAAEVDDAEEAISREHTLWLGSRSQL